MRTTLAALAVITVGYILAYLVFDRLRDRYGYVGGAEYVIIGFLLGPQVTGLLGAGQVQDLTPIVSLALGWLGMLLGTYFRVTTLALVTGDYLRIAFGEAAATFGCATAALVLLFRTILGYDWPDTWVQSVTLASIATLSSPAAVDVATRRPCPIATFPGAPTHRSNRRAGRRGGFRADSGGLPSGTSFPHRPTSHRNGMGRDQPGGWNHQRGAVPSLLGSANAPKRGRGEQPTLCCLGRCDRGGQRGELLSQSLADLH
jgi:hypothetical protein